jgi:nicotinate-nucleotide adenylyltransferase
MAEMELIGIFGGTFNPIHNGHLVLAQTVLETLHCTQIRFIPAAVPPHKETPAVTAQHRAAMVKLAIQGHAEYVLDTCELDRHGPSYTIETLHLLRQRFPNQSLCLIMGQDSYQKLPTWHRWHALLDYCHLLVVHRADLATELVLHAEHTHQFLSGERFTSECLVATHGFIGYLSESPPAISSTAIRAKLAHSGEAVPDLLPALVNQYIQQHHLYQPA